jgi:hypothetical protein
MSPAGSDTADGSIISPFKTLRGWVGARALQPGDTILVRGGTYYSPSGAGESWAPSVSGTASAPITIKAYPGEVPVFDGQASVGQAFVLSGVSYLTFDGLTFTKYHPVGNGVMIVSAVSHHIVFRNITATANAGASADTDQFFYIETGSHDILIDTVSVTGATAAAILIGQGSAVSNVTVKNSHLFGNGRGIIDGHGTVGTRITGNVIENNSMAQVHFHANSGYGSSGALMTGNTLRGAVGLWVESLAASPVAESQDCVSSSIPFTTGWPLSSGTVYTLAQWQATGRGTGDAVGICQ